MKHPIYNQKWVIGNIWISTNRGKDNSLILNAVRAGFKKEEFEIPLKIASEIEKNGLVLVEVKKDEFIDKVSINTLNKLHIKDLHYPFKAFSVLFDDKALISFMLNDDKSAIFQLEYPEINQRLLGNISADKDIKDIVSQTDNKALQEYIYAFFSVILYMTTFKNDTKRVPKPRVVKQSKIKNLKIPKKLSIIKLSPPKASKPKVGGGGKKNVMYLVRGHWRMQYYPSLKTHKPKWIDAHWRGIENEEKNEKIYKL